jgi:hypothetical protein
LFRSDWEAWNNKQFNWKQSYSNLPSLFQFNFISLVFSSKIVSAFAFYKNKVKTVKIKADTTLLKKANETKFDFNLNFPWSIMTFRFQFLRFYVRNDEPKEVNSHKFMKNRLSKTFQSSNKIHRNYDNLLQHFSTVAKVQIRS